MEVVKKMQISRGGKTISEMKNTVNRMNRLETIEEMFNELKTTVKETIQNETHREKNKTLNNEQNTGKLRGKS